MTVTVVGSIAFDAVKTPFGRRENGCSAARRRTSRSRRRFLIACGWSAPWERTSAQDEFDILAMRGTDVADVERIVRRSDVLLVR